MTKTPTRSKLRATRGHLSVIVTLFAALGAGVAQELPKGYFPGEPLAMRNMSLFVDQGGEAQIADAEIKVKGMLITSWKLKEFLSSSHPSHQLRGDYQVGLVSEADEIFSVDGWVPVVSLVPDFLAPGTRIRLVDLQSASAFGVKEVGEYYVTSSGALCREYKILGLRIRENARTIGLSLTSPTLILASSILARRFLTRRRRRSTGGVADV